MVLPIIAKVVIFAVVKKVVAFSVAKYYGFHRIYRRLIQGSRILVKDQQQQTKFKSIIRNTMRFPNKILAYYRSISGQKPTTLSSSGVSIPQPLNTDASATQIPKPQLNIEIEIKDKNSISRVEKAVVVDENKTKVIFSNPVKYSEKLKSVLVNEKNQVKTRLSILQENAKKSMTPPNSNGQVEQR